MADGRPKHEARPVDSGAKMAVDRRDFLKRSGSWAVGVVGWNSAVGAIASATLPNPIGYATISWPRSQFTHALDTIASLGFKGVQLLGWVRDDYPGGKFGELKDRLNGLRLSPVALSCWGVKLDPAQVTDQSAKIRDFAEFQSGLGGLFLQVTDDGRPGGQYSPTQIKALGEQMSALGKLATDSGVALGYHPHFNSLGETREGMARILDATDPRYVKLIADVGHILLGGSDPAEVIRTYHERLIMMHFKDVRKDIAALAEKDRGLVRKGQYAFCEIGEGAVNFPAVLQALRDVQFSGWIVIELDNFELPPGGPDEAARRNKANVEKLGLGVIG
jgi:inosose dehydratase